MSSGVTSMPASRRLSTQSKPFSFGLRAQPGAPITGVAAELAEDEEVARIDRHAEMDDAPAGRLDAAGTTSRVVDHRRGAEDDEEVAPRRLQLGKRRGDGAGVVGDADLARRAVAPAGASRSSRSRRVLSITDGFSDGSVVATSPTLQRPEGGDADRADRAPPAAVEAAAGDRERDDLHRRDHPARLDDGVFGQRRDGDRRVDAVQRVDRARGRRRARRPPRHRGWSAR